MSTKDATTTPEPQNPRVQRLLGEYARSTGAHDGEPLHTVACDLIADILTLAAGDPDRQPPESYGTTTTERVASLAARSTWNALEAHARRAAEADGATEPDGPSFEDIDTAIAVTDAYLRSA